MSHKTGVSEIGDGIGDEPVVEFLRIVDFLAAGHSCGVDVADVVEVIAQRARYVPISDLRVVNVIQDFHTWRIDALDHIKSPCHMVEDLIGALVRSHLGVRNFDANSDVLLLGITLHAVQYRDSVIGAFFPGHATPFAGDRNQNGASNACARVDPGMSGFFNLVVEFLADQSILEARSGAYHHGGRQAILGQDRDLLGAGQIYALETNARENLAPLLERERRAHPNRSHHALLNARAWSCRSLGGQLTGDPRGYSRGNPLNQGRSRGR